MQNGTSDRMRWGYRTGEGSKLPTPIEISIDSHPNLLLTGGSGSGKSYGLLYLLGMLLQDSPEIELYILDFKYSEDFEFLDGYEHYFKGNECYEGVMEYYEKFCRKRQERNSRKRMMLIFDEYPACYSYLSAIDKREKSKKASDMANAIAEILMLGRGIKCGIWIVTQRADASLFANGSRDSFMVILAMGRMSREQRGMLFAGEDIPDKIYHRGEGCMLADGHPLYEVAIPKIGNMIDWKKHIKQVLMKK